jgi:DNA-binding CsgD family transcriptional regulator
MIAHGADHSTLIRIGVCIAVSDTQLARRLVAFLDEDAAFETLFEDPDDCDPDVTLTDRLVDLPGPSILIADSTRGPLVLPGEVRAVLPPHIDGGLLRAAIRIASAGYVIAEVDDAQRLHRCSFGSDQAVIAEDGETELTPREREVLLLLAQGAPNKSIARELDISVHTAKFHVASLLAKLGARNRSDALAIGIKRGVILL